MGSEPIEDFFIIETESVDVTRGISYGVPPYYVLDCHLAICCILDACGFLVIYNAFGHIQYSVTRHVVSLSQNGGYTFMILE